MKNKLTLIILFVTIILFSGCQTELDSNQIKTPNKKAQVMILGTYHFAEKGIHLVNVNSEDILNDKKQKEIEQVIDLISKFKPTKIGVEVNYKNEESLNILYQQYLKTNKLQENNIISKSNEVFQFSFPIAKTFHHEKLYALDYFVALPEKVFDSAQKNNYPIYSKVMKNLNSLKNTFDKKVKNNSILEVLRYLNDSNQIDSQNNDFFITLAQVGAGKEFEGVDYLTQWYRRNLYTFSNIQKIAKPNDRILIIYGIDHSKILKELIKSDSNMEFIDITDYLY